ncbi:MAG: preprotein translocase subunit SecG [Ruminococcaceae bacterium]|nr:preprotein translocase subunit SecG [Oscillospiraceae bacterium]
MQIAIGIILIIAALFLIVAVLMQHGKSHNLSGTIAGGAETFFGKTKGSTLDKKLSKLTTIVAIVFCVLVLVSYLIQDTTDFSDLMGSANMGNAAETVDHDHDHDHEAEGEIAAEGEAAVEEEAAAE